MPKVWFFGDSFTYGHGCHPQYSYYTLTVPKLRWTEIVSKNLKLEEKNLGHNGFSNEAILESIINNLKSISKKDAIVIGTTSPLRTQIFDPKLNKIKSVSSDALISKQNHWNIPHRGTLIDYIYKYKVPYELEWSKYYRELFSHLCKSVTDRFYIWEYSNEWENHESISVETNNRISNSHWSWNGHKTMGEKVTKQLRNGFI